MDFSNIRYDVHHDFRPKVIADDVKAEILREVMEIHFGPDLAMAILCNVVAADRAKSAPTNTARE